MSKTFSLQVTPYRWENVKEQRREYGPLELTNKALRPYLDHVKIPPLLPEAAVEEDKMLDKPESHPLPLWLGVFLSLKAKV